jgi:hypothetical protein
MLLSLVVKLLNKELVLSNSAARSSNNELIYILFLYLSSLDIKVNESTQIEIPNPAILLYSINLKEHEDIKIRKVAQQQISIFEKLVVSIN